MITQMNETRLSRRLSPVCVSAVLVAVFLLVTTSCALAETERGTFRNDPAYWTSRLEQQDLTLAELREALWATYMVGPDCAGALPRIEQELANRDGEASTYAALALASVSGLISWHYFHPGEPYEGEPFPELAVDPVSAGLESEYVAVQKAALSVLMCINDRAIPAIPGIIDLLDAPDSKVVLDAQMILRRLGGLAAAARPALEENLRHADPDISISAELALKAIDGDEYISQLWINCTSSVKIVRTMLPKLESSDPRAVTMSQMALVGFGNNAFEALPQLRKNLSHGDPEVRRTASEAIAAIESGKPFVIPEPKESDQESSKSLRMTFGRALGFCAVMIAAFLLLIAVAAYIKGRRYGPYDRGEGSRWEFFVGLFERRRQDDIDRNR